jgi:hypothetical protein
LRVGSATLTIVVSTLIASAATSTTVRMRMGRACGGAACSARRFGALILIGDPHVDGSNIGKHGSRS